MYVDDGVIHIEKTDQCYTCEYFAKGVQCPLLEALGLGVVELVDEMTVQNCGFYKKFSRHLRVVDEEADEGDAMDESDASDDEESDGDSSLHVV